MVVNVHEVCNFPSLRTKRSNPVAIKRLISASNDSKVAASPLARKDGNLYIPGTFTILLGQG